MNTLLKSSFLLFFLFLSINCFCQDDGSVSEESSIAKASNVRIRSSAIMDREDEIFYGFKKDSKILIPFEYDELPSVLAPLMRAKKNQKYGIINSKNEIIVPFVYDALPYPLLDFMLVRMDEKEGLIDMKGRIIIPVEYQGVYKSPFEENIYIAVSEDKINEFDREGNMQKSDFIYFKNYQYKKIVSVGNNAGKYGIVDYQKKEIIPLVYDCPLESFRNIDGIYQWKTCVNQKYGVIDIDQKLILAFEYEDVKKVCFNNWFEIREGKNVGIINEEGETIVPIEYDETSPIAINRTGNRLVIVTKDDLRGVYHEARKVIIPLEYEYLKFMRHKFIKVGKGDEFGLFDLNGKLVLPCEFEEDIIFKNNTLTACRKLERKGKYSSDGQLVPAKKFQFQEQLGDYLVVASSNEAGAKKGLVDNVGNLIALPDYDSFRVQKFENLGYNFFIFEKEGKFAFSVDNLLSKIQVLNKFTYDNLAFGIYKKDGKKLIAKGHDLKDIIGYSLSPNRKERTYINIRVQEILIK